MLFAVSPTENLAYHDVINKTSVDISPFRDYCRGPENDRYKSQTPTQFSEPEAS